MTSSNDVCIVYSQDAKSWPEYLVGCCQSKIRFRSVAESELEQRQNQTVTGTRPTQTPDVFDARAIIVIVSPGHVDFLFDHVPKSNSQTGSSGQIYRDFGPNNGLIFLCYEGGIDLTSVYREENGVPKKGNRRPSEHFPDLERWPQIRYDADASEIKAAVEKLLQTSQPPLQRDRPSVTRTPSKPTEGTSGPTQKKIQTRLSQDDVQTVVVHPTTARSEEPTSIVLSFSSEVPQDAEVDVMLTEEVESLGETIIASRLNPYTYTFEAPDHQAGKVFVKVRVNGNSVSPGEQGQENLTLTYTAELSGIFKDVSQIYMHLLTIMCNQLLGGGRSSVPMPPGKGGQTQMSVEALDTKLSGLFDLENPPADIPTVGFEQLFGIYRYIDADESEKNSELPTLIHFAAKFGLTELCNKLTDLPDAERAVNLANSKNKLPHEIAHDNRFVDLEIFLQDFLETQTMYYNQHRARYWNSNLVTKEPYYMPMNKLYGVTGQSHYVSVDDGVAESDELYVAVGEEYTAAQMFTPVADRGAPTATSKKEDINMPEHQRKLVEIMDKVKNKEMTQAQAERAFQQWKADHHLSIQSKSFKEKKEMLSMMKLEMQNISRLAVPVASPDLGAANTAPAPVGRAKFLMSTGSNSPGNRGSNSSISSRDSVASVASSRSSRSSTSIGYTSEADLPQQNLAGNTLSPTAKPPTTSVKPTGPALPPRQIGRGAPAVPRRN